MLVQDLQIELIGPPVTIRSAASGGVGFGFTGYRAFAFTHLRSPVLWGSFFMIVRKTVLPSVTRAALSADPDGRIVVLTIRVRKKSLSCPNSACLGHAHLLIGTIPENNPSVNHPPENIMR
jgi:hypothetical protein